jgi:hypothetical protein
MISIACSVVTSTDFGRSYCREATERASEEMNESPANYFTAFGNVLSQPVYVLTEIISIPISVPSRML